MKNFFKFLLILFWILVCAIAFILTYKHLSFKEETVEEEPSAIVHRIPAGDVSVGNLLLINREHPYIFPGDPEKTLVKLKPSVGSYRLLNVYMSLDSTAWSALTTLLDAFSAAHQNDEILITSAYLSYEEQDALYRSHGDPFDPPGYSDLHMGKSVHLVLVLSDGFHVPLESRPEYETWFRENAWKYGYIQRYPEGKAYITGVDGNPGQFRYVDLPHAYYITQNGLSLEEYLGWLKQNTSADGRHLTVAVDGGATYEVYYVGITGDTVEIAIPHGCPYTVSGDNQNGFIVTVTLD